jgi:AcrR family transcriptional regulator
MDGTTAPVPGRAARGRATAAGAASAGGPAGPMGDTCRQETPDMDDTQDKKARILKATLGLITDNGFHGTPVSMIADAAGVGAGTIYRYFANKEAIINELWDRIQKDLHAATLADIPDGVSVRDEFYLKWRNILRFFLDHPDEARFLEQYSASPFISPELTEEKNRRNAHLKVLIARGRETGVIREIDYHTVAVLMWGTVHQLHQLQASGIRQVSEELVDGIFRVVWDGMRLRES